MRDGVADACGDVAESDAVLGTARTRERGLDAPEIKVEHRAVFRLGRRLVVPETLGARVGFDPGDLVLGPSGETEVVGGCAVDREERAGRAELGGHVAERGAVGDGKRREA